MGFEPTTFCLGSRYSTPELHPLVCSLSINFITKSRVNNTIRNGSKINLPQSLPHLVPMGSASREIYGGFKCTERFLI